MGKTISVDPFAALPKKAKRTLVDALRQPAGTRLPIAWYEFRRGSNFDKYPREQLRDLAEVAGFVEYKAGYPWITDAGHNWANDQPNT